MGNSALGKVTPNINKAPNISKVPNTTSNQKFLNWLYYLKHGYDKKDYSKVVLEEDTIDTDSNTIKQIKKDVAALSLTVKSSNSFVTLTKNTILSYVIVLILFLIILSLNINILTNTACKVDDLEGFSNKIKRPFINRHNRHNRHNFHRFY